MEIDLWPKKIRFNKKINMENSLYEMLDSPLFNKDNYRHTYNELYINYAHFVKKSQKLYIICPFIYNYYAHSPLY